MMDKVDLGVKLSRWKKSVEASSKAFREANSSQ